MNKLAVIVTLVPFLYFHRRLIKYAVLSLFTFKWQGKSLGRVSYVVYVYTLVCATDVKIVRSSEAQCITEESP